MKIITDLCENKKSCNIKKPVVAIGFFDGLHKGHQRILQIAVKQARAINGTSCVITFDPHPIKVLTEKKSIPLITSTAHKLKLIERTGIEKCFLVDFNKRFSNLSAKDFVLNILVSKLKIAELVIGENFCFGKNCYGNVAFLKKQAKKYNFKINIIKSRTIGKKVISSTSIRKYIETGNILKAEKFLGRKVSVLGTVINGTAIGRLMGMPTANIDPHHEAIPKMGIYAVYIKVDNKKYNGIAYIGTRPTLSSSSKIVVEVNIFNFKQNIYGKDIEVFFVKRIRTDKKFINKQALIKQMNLDKKKALKYLK